MSSQTQVSRQRRIRRHQRLRNRLRGMPERPRLSVFRSGANIYAQIIDDTIGHTLAAASSLEAGASGGTKTTQARKVGELVATRARERGITRVVYDRGGFLYHGRVKAVAEGARGAGLEF